MFDLIKKHNKRQARMQKTFTEHEPFKPSLQRPIPPAVQGCIWTGEYSQSQRGMSIKAAGRPSCQVQPEATLALIYSTTQLMQTDVSPLVFYFMSPFPPPLGSLTTTPLKHTYIHDKSNKHFFAYFSFLFEDFLYLTIQYNILLFPELRNVYILKTKWNLKHINSK